MYAVTTRHPKGCHSGASSLHRCHSSVTPVPPHTGVTQVSLPCLLTLVSLWCWCHSCVHPVLVSLQCLLLMPVSLQCLLLTQVSLWCHSGVGAISVSLWFWCHSGASSLQPVSLRCHSSVGVTPVLVSLRCHSGPSSLHRCHSGVILVLVSLWCWCLTSVTGASVTKLLVL